MSEYEKQRRARLDRLNAAYLEAKRTQKFPASGEFSQYEIAIDNEVDVVTRWEISAREHDVGENDLEADHYNAFLFRSRSEYDAEFRRRYAIYKEKVACSSDHGLKWPKLSRTHPDWIDCENRVNAEYYPRGQAQLEAVRWRTYQDIQMAMPALTEEGPIAAFGFHVTHQYLGWSTERSAAFAGALATVTDLAMLRAQQRAVTQNAGRSVAPPDEISPPPDNVASAPVRDPVPPPGRSAGPAADPLAGSVPTPVDVANRGAVSPATQPAPVTQPPPATEIEQAAQRYERLRTKAAQAEEDYARSLRNTVRATERRGDQPTQQEADLLRMKKALEAARDDAQAKLKQLKAQQQAAQPNAGGRTPGQQGFAQEPVYLQELRARGLDAQLTDANAPVIDAAIIGTAEVHSVKSIVAGTDAAVTLAERGSPRDLANSVSAKITEALVDRRSDKWNRLRNQWNTTKRDTYADRFGYELPKNPDDIAFVVDVRVITGTAPSAAARQAVEAAVQGWLTANERVPPRFTWRIVYVTK
ncbi:MAG TPA: hypothetical protein VHI13_08755 [Candidatus Kapabacteria bacterium]|nr:hypothetical protein [Candidatus Kapabacteria bacterium]